MHRLGYIGIGLKQEPEQISNHQENFQKLDLKIKPTIKDEGKRGDSEK